MNQEIKERWVTALRSGDYEQGTARLNTNDEKFCCLGVLCELAVADGVIQKFDKPDEIEQMTLIYYGDPEGEMENAVLPPQVVEWAGLTEANPEPYAGRTVASLNDAGYEFPFLAELIKDKL